MWKDFCELSRSVDKSGGWVRSPETAVVRELALVTTQTKLILNALRQSFTQGNIEIDISKDLALIRERFEQLAETLETMLINHSNVPNLIIEPHTPTIIAL